MTTLLFIDPTFLVILDSGRQWLYIKWQGVQDRVSSLASCALILRYVQQTQVRKLLCDSREAIDGWDELSEWLQGTYFPLLWKEEIEAIAWVDAEDAETKQAIQEFTLQVTQPRITTFKQVAPAQEWLLAIPTQPVTSEAGGV